MNGGGIRTSIDAGPITLGELLDVQPFSNQLSLVTLTGAQLKEALENGVSVRSKPWPGASRRFPNMRYSYDPALAVGSRVTGVQIGDGKGGYTALDPAGSYRVATINFLLAGGDGYTVLSQGTNKLDTGLLDVDVTTEYVVARSPVNPQVEGRIIVGGTLPGAVAPRQHRHPGAAAEHRRRPDTAMAAGRAGRQRHGCRRTPAQPRAARPAGHGRGCGGGNDHRGADRDRGLSAFVPLGYHG